MDLEIPHVRESHGCGEDDRYGYLGGEISEEKFPGRSRFVAVVMTTTMSRQTTNEMARATKVCFQEKRLFRMNYPPNVAQFFGFRRGGIRDIFSESWDMGGLTLADDGV